jgi:hypothetical protein
MLDISPMEENNMLSRIALLSVVLAAVTGSAHASVLDQSYVPSGDVPPLSADVGTNGIGKVEIAQTFDVGLSGRLAAADLFLSGYEHENLSLEIRRTLPNGLPSEAPDALLGAAITTPSGPLFPYHFVSFDFNGQGPMVTAGEHLALVLKVPGTSKFSWGGDSTNPYAGGSAADRSAYSLDQWAQTAGPQNDLGFMTYVEPVPEPSTLSIVLVGGLGVIVAARRRKLAGAHPDHPDQAG